MPTDVPQIPLNSIANLYKNWYLDYASYVILERAIPNLGDGLKPVQRRILHAMREMDDGRFNKVANIVGQSMQYHPHGDASINDAIVKMGQKDLLIETQGNWGDIRTGDGAAAVRYIEARFSNFALDVLFSPKVTAWGLSYDGRKKEPILLPVKFPLLLAQGALGIAVGFATEILPHNFCELIQAAIKYLKKRNFELYPDFQTGGSIDVENYNDGKRGGKIICRAKIEELDKKTLVIRDLPYSVTTSALCDSIVKANDNGKIKIKKVIDNTAEDVEILIELATGISPDITIRALYAFTDCQVSISPNACIISNDKPVFIGVSEVLKNSVDNTKYILEKELHIKLHELEEAWHYSSLEKIFIENKIYRDIEEQTTWEGVLKSIDIGLEPFKKKFKRIITQDDIIKLTEIKIKRISKFDTKKADELLKDINNQIKDTKLDIQNIIDYTINFYETLLKKYGKNKERKTEIRKLDTIEAKEVVLANTKIFVDKKEGFIGTSLKSEELIGVCSNLDDVIVLKKDGTMIISKVVEKLFVGKNILWADIFKKNDERTIYHMIYLDGESGKSLVKRFNVIGITRDKEYNLISTHKNSKVHYLSVHKNGEAEEVEIYLSPNCNAQKKIFNFNFKSIEIKGRGALGNQLTKYPIRNIKQKSVGESTLGGLKIWYNPEFGKLVNDGNTDMLFIGELNPDDNLLIVYKDGNYEITNIDLLQRFEADKVLLIEKFKPSNIINIVYKDDEKKAILVKRFNIETQMLKTKFMCIKEGQGNEILLVSTKNNPKIKVSIGKKSDIKTTIHKATDIVEISSWRSVGNKLCDSKNITVGWDK